MIDYIEYYSENKLSRKFIQFYLLFSLYFYTPTTNQNINYYHNYSTYVINSESNKNRSTLMYAVFFV